MGEQSKTLVEKIADDIIYMIQTEGYQPGDKLPTEKELSLQLNAGRNSVREALKLLMSKNIVIIRQGAGAFISEKQGIADDPLGFSFVANRRKLTKDLLQVRAMLEPSIAGLAAQHASEKEVLELGKILEQMEIAIRKKNDYSKLDAQFHEKIAECTHNQVMKNLIPVITNGITIFAEEVEETEYEQTLVSHRKIYEYIKMHKPYEAEMEMQFHILYNNNRYSNIE